MFTDKLTLAGRLLLVFCVLLFAAGFYMGFSIAANSGDSFPLFVIFAPPIILSVFIFFGGAWLLERCGIQIYNPKNSS